MKTTLAAIVLVLAFAACSQTADSAATGTTSAPATAASGASWMDTFSMPANLQTTPSGLQYWIEQPGTGPQPQAGQTVRVHYTGWTADGAEFDSSRNGLPLEFPIGQGRVIKGWDEGIAAMKVGERRTLVIPPSLGYGARGMSPGIPPNATLVFRVQLVGVQ